MRRVIIVTVNLAFSTLCSIVSSGVVADSRVPAVHAHPHPIKAPKLLKLS